MPDPPECSCRQEIKSADEEISAAKPWSLGDKEEVKKVLAPIAQKILSIAELLQPFLPTTAEKIIAQFSEKQIKKGESLFPRLVSETGK